MDIYSTKETAYFSHSRNDLISLIPSNSSNKILELGAGGGDTLVSIKKLNLASEVVGIELFKMEKTNQNNPLIDNFYVGNVETLQLNLQPNYFDVIICGDVLEHLLDPWAVVAKYGASLKVGGVIIASIPNIREITTFKKIYLRGDFKYEQEGTFDRTHLRFFCKKNMIDLLQPKGFQVINIKTSFDFYQKNTKRYYFNKLTFGVFKGLLANNFIMVSKKLN
jgi:2-polyprenyl-3-methyl-5-hydroxy-6-metoxy-1,4-benzoquinol methylase